MEDSSQPFDDDIDGSEDFRSEISKDATSTSNIFSPSTISPTLAKFVSGVSQDVLAKISSEVKEGMSEEEIKKMIIKIRNRDSAQRSRERKQQYVRQLEDKMRELEQKNRSLSEGALVRQLREQNEDLRLKNDKLKNTVATLEHMIVQMEFSGRAEGDARLKHDNVWLREVVRGHERELEHLRLKIVRIIPELIRENRELRERVHKDDRTLSGFSFESQSRGHQASSTSGGSASLFEDSSGPLKTEHPMRTHSYDSSVFGLGGQSKAFSSHPPRNHSYDGPRGSADTLMADDEAKLADDPSPSIQPSAVSVQPQLSSQGGGPSQIPRFQSPTLFTRIHGSPAEE